MLYLFASFLAVVATFFYLFVYDPGFDSWSGSSFFALLCITCCLEQLFFNFYRSDFVYDIFEHMNIEESGGGGGGGMIGRKPTALGKRGGKRKKATVSSQFKVSLCFK